MKTRAEGRAGDRSIGILYYNEMCVAPIKPYQVAYSITLYPLK